MDVAGGTEADVEGVIVLSISVLGVLLCGTLCCCLCVYPRMLTSSWKRIRGQTKRRSKKLRQKIGKAREATRLKHTSRPYRKVRTAIPVDEVSSADEQIDGPRTQAAEEGTSPRAMAWPANELRPQALGLESSKGCSSADRGVTLEFAPSQTTAGHIIDMAAPPPVRTLADINGPLQFQQQLQPPRNVGYAEGDDLTMVALARLPPRSQERAEV